MMYMMLLPVAFLMYGVLTERDSADSDSDCSSAVQVSFSRSREAVPDGDYDCDLDGHTDCKSWDAAGVKCEHLDKCEYRYKFGDMSLGQSCRCKPGSAPTDYDCDGDGVEQCNKWDYAKTGCENSYACSYQYKFGDMTFDESCRCKPECMGAGNACKPEPTEYDCDGDGASDCGEWEYGTAMCKNLATCKYDYKAGDITLDQSCRCRRCAKSGGTSDLINASMGGTIFWNYWINWADHYDTCAPWMMPSNDADLQKLLAYAKSKNYIVRPSGAGHSAGPLVDDGLNDNVFVVSLGAYTAPDEWEYSLDKDKKLVKVNAGWSQLDLYEKIRPQGLFFPTQTAGYFFQLAGVIANSVHGAAYDKSFVHSYITRMRVMLHDGSIKIISGEEMKYWRNSLGLLGLILSVEMELSEKTEYQMYTKTRKVEEWSETEYWKFILEDAEANLPASISGGRSGGGTRKSFAGEFFIDLLPTRPSFIVYANKENENANEPGFSSTIPDNIHEGYEKRRNTPVTVRASPVDDPNRPKQVPYGESIRREGCPPYYLGVGDTINVNKLIGTKLMPTLGRVIDPLRFSAQTIIQLPGLVKEQRDLVNDGYFAMKAPNAIIAAYFIKPELSFKAMDWLRQRVIARNGMATWFNASGFSWNQPAEFRFVNVTDDAVLHPVPPGLWFVSEVISFPDAAQTDQEWKKAFKEVEDYWINELDAKPHYGKLFGFVEEHDEIKMFGQQRVCKVLTDHQKHQFETYRQSMDPEGRFNYGLGSRLLESC